jgi:hypothetical protein
MFRDDNEALRAAEAGMEAGGKLFSIVPLYAGGNGMHRVYWKVLDSKHCDEIDAAISKALFPDEEPTQ